MKKWSFFWYNRHIDILGSDIVVGKKLSIIEILVIVISLLVMCLAVIDAYRISSFFHEVPINQSYIYDTTIFSVPIIIILLYIIVFIKLYKKL